MIDDRALVKMVPVPGNPGDEIETLTDDELDEVIAHKGGDGEEPFPESWVYALACEVKHLRGALANDDVVPAHLATLAVRHACRLVESRDAEIASLRAELDELRRLHATERQVGGGS